MTLVRSAEAEVLGTDHAMIRLLADGRDTDGAVSASRTTLAAGVDGPPPHFHRGSAEIFFMLSGSLQALAGDRVITLDTGDFLVVPRLMPHAFGAVASSADVLILFAPGMLDRLDYFRLGDRVLKGQADPRELLATQDRFDNHFVESPPWQQVRA